MEHKTTLRIRLFSLLFPRKKSKVFMMKTDPEQGVRWWRNPKTREGDLWIKTDTRAVYYRRGNSWQRAYNKES